MKKPRVYTPTDLLGPLNDIEKKYAPKELYICGSLSIPLPHPRIAIVGSRQASPQALETAREITSTLVQNGGIIVSGLARGIDTVAHKTAIEEGGKTIAVLGTPLDKFYPRENAPLQRIIMEKHLAVSQFPINQPTRPRNFLERNKTIALISDVSIIVDARNSGGTINYGWNAIRLGRPLFIWKSVINNESLIQPRKMLKYGAMTLSDVNEVINYFPASN